MDADGLIVFCHGGVGILIALPHLTIVVVYDALVVLGDTLIVLIDAVNFAIVVADELVSGGFISTVYAVDFLIVAPDGLIVLILLLAEPIVEL
jgi:hypothetical protein